MFETMSRLHNIDDGDQQPGVQPGRLLICYTTSPYLHDSLSRPLACIGAY